MSNLKSMPNTFRRIGGRYNHYFDPNHFLGQDAFTDIWDSRNQTDPMVIKDKKHSGIFLPIISKSELMIMPK